MYAREIFVYVRVCVLREYFLIVHVHLRARARACVFICERACLFVSVFVIILECFF